MYSFGPCLVVSVWKFVSVFFILTTYLVQPALLSFVRKPSSRISCCMYVNLHFRRRCGGYVSPSLSSLSPRQMDRHLPTMTVQETFKFAFDSMSGGSHTRGRTQGDDTLTADQRDLISWMDSKYFKVSAIAVLLAAARARAGYNSGLNPDVRNEKLVFDARRRDGVRTPLVAQASQRKPSWPSSRPLASRPSPMTIFVGERSCFVCTSTHVLMDRREALCHPRDS